MTAAAPTIKPFTPLSVLSGALAQTVAGTLWPRDYLPGEGLEVRVPTAAGPLLARCHLQPDRERLAVLLLHGLEGSIDAAYLRGAACKARAAGFHVVRLNLRGPERLSPTLHPGRSEDVAEAILFLLEELGLARVALWGFSLGGNLALKLAGEAGAQPPSCLRGVVAISPLVDLAAATAALDQPANRIYTRLLLTRFRLRLLRRRAAYAMRHDLAALRRVRSIADFHERFAAPHYGFPSAAAYYAAASASPLLAQVNVPTLVLHAKDDPIVPLPEDAAAALYRNPSTELLLTATGGHVGFVSAGLPGEDRLWAENRAIAFLRRLE